MSVALLLIFSSIAGVALVGWSDRLALRHGIPTLGLVVVGMYVSTYGLGWLLWRSDPSSLFGEASLSTLGALDRMGLLFALGLPSVSIGYAFVRSLLPNDLASKTPLMAQVSFATRAKELQPILRHLCLLLVILSVLGMMGMSSQGVFIRDPQLQQQALQSSWLAKVLVGSSLMSRLAPIGLLLVPLCWPTWGRRTRIFLFGAISAWFVLAFNSGSRGQLLAIPLYLLLGAFLWRTLPLRRVLSCFLLVGLLALPVAEWMRVNRTGAPTNPSLARVFQNFQTGRQLIGTSHEMYLMLNPQDCAHDLDITLSREPQAQVWINSPPENLLPAQRYHVARLYHACKRRVVDLRKWTGFDGLPLGLLPSTFFPFAPSLFDGQHLVEEISRQLGLRPGEISNGTLSIFADGWWRYRYMGVVIFSVALGAVLGFTQAVLFWSQRPSPLLSFLGQLLALSLIGSWINNTALTLVWLLAWDLPKALFELLLFAYFLKFRFPIHQEL